MPASARRPELDSLRGVAIILVVASHAYWRDFIMGGPVGVAVFFALSGYLITRLLLHERQTTGRISLTRFYARRARRLLPALLAFLAAMVALGSLLGPVFATWRDTVPVLLYVQNYAHFAPILVHTLGHTWSLSVEEQFYIVFPVLLIGILRAVSPHTLPRVLIPLATAFLSLRVILWATGASFERVYYGTDSNAGLILVGAAAAAWCHVHRSRRDRAAWAPLLLPMLVVMGFVADRPAARTIVPVLAALAATAILVACADARVPGWLAPRWLVLVGQRSYGLYLWHYPMFHVLQPRMPAEWWTNLLLVAGSWGLTLLSWHFVEEPIQRWKPIGPGLRKPLLVSAPQPLG